MASLDASGMQAASPLARDTVVVELDPGQSVARAIDELSGLPGVAYVEPDYRVFAAATPDDPYYTSGSLWGMLGDATTPANPYGSGAAEAWVDGDIGSPNVYVGVIDEGIQISHPDLADNIWTNAGEIAGNQIDDDRNGYVDDVHGWDFFHDDASVFDPADGDVHGTHVAGTLGARGGNGVGVVGVDWRVSIIPAKFLGPDGGYVSDAVAAIDYITDLKLEQGLDIVATNDSWHGAGESQALLDAIERAGDADILFVAAAGNDGMDLDAEPGYPASFRCTSTAAGAARGWDCVVSVASLRPDGTLRADSNRGAVSVDLGAPGTGIISTIPDGSYGSMSGTSMATPHVSGALALCASIDPQRSARRLRTLLLGSVAATGSLGGASATGGRLDIGTMASECRAIPAIPSTSITVDEQRPTFRRTGTGWHDAWYGARGHHLWRWTRGGASSATGTWRPGLPAAGTYQVLARIPRNSQLSRKSRYEILTSGGWLVRTRDQWKHRGTWMSLGTFDLTAASVVRLADATGESGSGRRRLAYDALRFVPVAVPGSAAGSSTSSGRTPEPSAAADASLGPDPGATQGPGADATQGRPDAGATPGPDPDAIPGPTAEPTPAPDGGSPPSSTAEATPQPTPRQEREVTPGPSAAPTDASVTDQADRLAPNAQGAAPSG